MVKQVIVVGGGSAGFLAALSLKVRVPGLAVTVIRSKDIGIIMVGEGSTQSLPQALHGYLQIDPGEFYRRARPTWKLGIRFLWGSRPFFDYTFQPQLDRRREDLPNRNAHYASDDMEYVNLASSLMSHDKVFARNPNGEPLIGADVAYHVENAKFVGFLEAEAIRAGIPVLDDTVEDVRLDDRGVAALHLASGRACTADLYVDCSGFRSVLLGKALGEPFVDYKSTLYCDRAVAGGWERTDEPVKPYTTAETMDAGWCWQIEHEQLVNRGYVYSSAFISDDEAEREFRAKNPKVQSTRVIRFRTGRYRNAWVKNVVAVGLASGFVEPLEATSLAVVCDGCKLLVEVLQESDLAPTGHLVDLYNRLFGGGMDFIRGFLGVHYKFNTRLDTPFWRECREKVELGPVAEGMVDYYRHNGPAVWGSRLVLGQHDTFGVDGYLCMLVGQRVPHRNPYRPTDPERHLWEAHRVRNRARAEAGYSVPEALALVHSPAWHWNPDFYRSGLPGGAR